MNESRPPAANAAKSPDKRSRQKLPTVKGFTIDGPTTLDCDDALYFDELPEGGCEITISIAAPALYINIGSRSDGIAYDMGATRYFAAGNEPILPRRYSEKRISLLPGQRRKVVAITVKLDGNQDETDSGVAIAELTSAAKFTYDQVDGIIKGESANEYSQMLRRMYQVAEALLKKRREAGAMAIYDIFAGWRTTEDGLLVPLNPDERHMSYVIVQEFMILANRMVAKFCIENRIPILFRNHKTKDIAPPRQEILLNIANAVADPVTFPIETLRNRIGHLVEKATYGTILEGHYGLNLDAYMHFTSPIRRFADLASQRMIVAFLRGRPAPYTRERLGEIAVHLTRLDHERKQARSKGFADAAKRAAARILESGAMFQRMSADDFHVLIKTACRSGTLPDEFETETDRRMTEDQIGARDAYYLLFEANQATPAWIGIKKKTLQWLARHPEAAISIVHCGVQIGKMNLPETETISSGPDHARVFASVAKFADVTDGKPTTSRSFTTSPKKLAEQMSVVDLLHMLMRKRFGNEIPEYDSATAITSPASGKSPNASDASSSASKASSKVMPSADGNPISMLQEYALATKLKQPEYTDLPKRGPDHMPTFPCRCTAYYPDGSVCHEATAPNKKAAKTAAAEAARRDIIARLS